MSLLADVESFNPNPNSLTPEIPRAPSPDALDLTRNSSMRELYKQIKKIARVDVPVLFLGESGVGKEFFAKYLHSLSDRSERPFLKVNCAALPSELLESELFGYEAGAFTGATRPKPGQFELCDRGTILLDEIAEMSPPMQAKLLHVLQDLRFSRLGGRSMVQVNVRILAATNVRIEEALAEKKFRPDLYYRLNTIILHIPALRDRPEDIPLLLEHFMLAAASKFGIPPRPISGRVLEACLEYSWPGNVRELESLVCRLLLEEDEEALIARLEGASAPDTIEETSMDEPSFVHLGLKSLTREIRVQAEKHAIQQTLARTCWNRTEAARLLKISYKSLLNKIQQYGISALPQTPCPEDRRDSLGVEFGQRKYLYSKHLSRERVPLHRPQPPEPVGRPEVRKMDNPSRESEPECAVGQFAT
jgi:two-component system, NtrC family, response regulator AtoC